MQNNMTSLSYQAAVSGSLTIQEAVRFLEKEAKPRNLSETLQKFYKKQDLRKTLLEGLMRNHPDLKKETAEKRVREWLNRKDRRFLKKKDAIEICFILGLSIEEAEQFTAMVSEEAVHWRDPDEIVYIYALLHHMDYLEAQELDQRMKKILSEAKKTKNPPERAFTHLVRAEVLALHTEEELEQYLKNEAERLGKYHNNAYRQFTEMLEILASPATEEDMLGCEHLSIRDIIKEYFYENNVLYAKRAAVRDRRDAGKGKISEEERFMLTEIQKSIGESWPDETSLSRMRSRQADVTRKVLVLLFLAAYAGPDVPEDDLDQEPGEGEIFEDIYEKLNDLMILCGFPVLDPRVPFDWLVLYCICAQDLFDMDGRMKGIFKEMYGEAPKESGD